MKPEGIPQSMLSITIMDIQISLGYAWPQDNAKGQRPCYISAKLVFCSLFTAPGEFMGCGQSEPVPELLHCLCDNVADH